MSRRRKNDQEDPLTSFFAEADGGAHRPGDAVGLRRHMGPDRQRPLAGAEKIFSQLYDLGAAHGTGAAGISPARRISHAGRLHHRPAHAHQPRRSACDSIQAAMESSWQWSIHRRRIMTMWWLFPTSG